MIKFTTTVFFFLFLIKINAQVCTPSSFSTQEAIDLFLVNNPTCTEIDGNLNLFGSGITNLNGLKNIKKIKGIFTINNTSLTNLNEMTALQSAGGLQIYGNEMLSDIAGLTSLSKLDGDLELKYNALIGNVSLPALTQVKRFIVKDNSALNTIVFNNLENVNGHFSFSKVDLLKSLSFPKLNTIGGNFELLQMLDLENLDLVGLDSINGSLNIFAPLLKTFSLPQLQYLKEGISLIGMDACTSISMPALKAHQGRLAISLPSLVDLNMQSLESVSGDFGLTANPKLQALNLPSLQKIAGVATISYNPEITDISMGKLKMITSNLNIENNTKLANVDLTLLDSIKGRTEINRNGNMQMLGLNNLKHTLNYKSEYNLGKMTVNLSSLNSVNQWCQFSHNNELTSLNLSSLQKVSTFYINENNALDNVTLPSLKKAGTVQIFDNPILKIIESSVDTISGGFYITNNPLLESIIAKKTKSIGALTITENAILTNADFESLNNVGTGVTLRLPKEGEFNFSNLKIVKSTLEFNCVNNTFEFASLERTGSLYIRGNKVMTGISFPKLKISNTLSLDLNTKLLTITAPVLDSIGDLYINHNDSLKEVIFPLTKAKKIDVSSNKSIKKLAFDDLIESEINIDNNVVLSLLSLPVLELSTRVSIDRNTKLTSLVIDKLKSVSGSFECSSTAIPELNLPNLVNVLKGMDIVGNSFMTKMSMPNLKSVSFFNLDRNVALTSLVFPELISSGSFHIINNPILFEIQADKVKSSSLNIEGNPVLKNVSFKSVLELDILQLRSNIGIKKFNLDMLNVVYSDFFISYNDSLQSVGFPKLAKIHDEFTLSGTKISKLSLSSLEEVGKSLNAAAMIVDSFSLPKLKKVGADLRIGNLSKIANIYFPSLNSVGGPLVISDCKKLVSLSGISRLRANNFTLANWYISITGCTQLSFCNVPFLCEAAVSFPAKVYFATNATGCNDESELSCSFIFISGKIYYDKNKNGIQDNNEYAIPNAKIIDEETNRIYYCDESGVFSFAGEENEKYKLVPILPNNMALSTPSQSYEFVFNLGQANYHLFNFGMYFTSDVKKLEVEVANERMRCNAENFIKLSYYNSGSATINGYLEVNIDDRITYLNASTLPLKIQGNKIEWKIDNLEPFALNEIVINVKAPSEMFTGEIVSIKAATYSDAEHKNKLGESSIDKEVRCSFDPNDKAVSPYAERSDNPTPFMTPFQYTIRFQNTGNDVAYDVEIRDTLDANLDLTTFKIINSSFPVNTSMLDNKVSFKFNDINLPSQKQNEPASHGYVTYSVTPLSNLSPSTQIFNKAGIYFDSNPPIITNQVVSTLIETSTDDTEKSNTCYLRPNISSQEICIINQNLSFRPIKAELYDARGSFMKYVNTTCLNIQDFSNGMYFLKIYDNKKSETLKFVKME